MAWIDDLNNAQDVGNVYRYQAPKKQPKKASFLQSLLPTAGGIGGGVGGGALGGALAGTAILPGIGTAAGGLLGALLGGAAGGAAGKVIENKQMHQGAFHDVGKEALTQGALSAGPIRLLKGAATAGKLATSGVSLADALTAGGTRAAAPSAIKSALADKLGGASENLTSKALGITKGQKNKILETTGEKAGAIAKKYGIQTADDVPKVTKPMYNEFNAAVKAIPQTFSKDDVHTAFKGVYEPLLAKGQPLGHQAVGERIKAEAENLLEGVSSKGISAAELNTKRQAFDKLAYKAKGTDPQLYDVNKQSRDVLAKLVHNAADNAGIKTSSGLSLKELGKEINKVERVGKAAAKNREGAGGHMAIGLGNTPLTIVGAGSGPIGAAAGLGTNMAINSTAGRKAASTILDKAATAAESSATKGAANPFGLKGVAKRSLPVGLLGAVENQAQSMSNPASDSAATNTMMPSISNMPSGYSANADPSIEDPNAAAPDNSPFSPANIENNVATMVSQGAKMKDIQAYLSMAETIQKLTASSDPKKLNSSQQQMASNAQSGLDSLSTIAQTLKSNPNAPKLSSLPGGSLTGALTGTGSYKAALANVSDVIGRLRSGGAIQAQEEKRFLSMLPQTFDTPETAQYKISQVAQLLQRFANPPAAQPDTSSLVAALGG